VWRPIAITIDIYINQNARRTIYNFFYYFDIFGTFVAHHCTIEMADTKPN
jgi:hypothetical protein